MEALSKLPILLFASILIVSFATFAYFSTRKTAFAMSKMAIGQKRSNFHSLPLYHSWFSVLIITIPAFAALIIIGALRPVITNSYVKQNLPESAKAMNSDELALFLQDVQKFAFGGDVSQASPDIEALGSAISSLDGYVALGGFVIALVLAAIGFFWSKTKIRADFRARNHVETIIKSIMIVSASIAILTTFGIVLSLVFETFKFLSVYSPLDFLFGTAWSPQVAIRADQVGQSGSFGAVPLFLGTFMIMLIAMIIAVPIGLGSAIYLSEYASARSREIIKPFLELLAGIPTVVFGFFALLFVAPLIRDLGQAIGLETSAQSALAAGLVMGIMIIPYISSLSDDVINAVPQALRDGSYAMGATKSETINKVILPAALPGVIGSILLGISKALGETMIVTMAAGQNANMTLNPLDMMTTVTVQIVTLLTGDQEYDSPKTHAAFALGFVLFFATLILNVIALRIVQKYREKYD